MHRDLAARNIMVDNGYTYKVGDFGMSRALQTSDGDKDYYTMRAGGLVPVRWCAIEVLRDGKFSTPSDVWAFGILMYECVTWAKLPYAGLRPDQILLHLEGGSRLENPHEPDVLPVEIYIMLMRDPWHSTPSERPTFNEILISMSATFLLPGSNSRSFGAQPRRPTLASVGQ